MSVNSTRPSEASEAFCDACAAAGVDNIATELSSNNVLVLVETIWCPPDPDSQPVPYAGTEGE
jgi:hypothetical protein